MTTSAATVATATAATNSAKPNNNGLFNSVEQPIIVWNYTLYFEPLQMAIFLKLRETNNAKTVIEVSVRRIVVATKRNTTDARTAVPTTATQNAVAT